MERNWTKVGEEHTKDKQAQIAKIIEALEWKSLPCEMGMMPGEDIKAAIKQIRIPRVNRVAVSYEMAPYGFSPFVLRITLNKLLLPNKLLFCYTGSHFLLT